MATPSERINGLVESHQIIVECVDRCDRNPKIYPRWTIRKILAPFNRWDDTVLSSFETPAAGSIPGVVVERGSDHYGAATVKECKALRFEQIFNEWQTAHEQLKIAILELPLDELEAEKLEA